MEARTSALKAKEPIENYTIVEFQGESAFHTLKDDWTALWRLSEDATESQTWNWQYLYWKHLAPNTDPLIIVVRDSRETCIALASFFVGRDSSSWISKAAFLGDKRPDYHLILAKPGVPASVGLRIFERFAAKLGNRVRCLELSNVPQDSYTGSILGRFPANEDTSRSITVRWETQTYAVPLPSTIEEYLKQLGPRSRRDFRYDRRQLSNEFSVDFRVYNSLENLNEALDAIEVVDRARWGSNSRYCLSSHRSFERSIATALCEMGIYRAFVLYLNNTPHAFVTGAVVRNMLKVASIGFDRLVPGKWSVGKVTNFYAIEHCIEIGLRQFDLTRGGEEYKKWLGGVPSTNLHVRRYRSRWDEMLNSGGTRIVSFLRNQTQLRGAYQKLFRR